MKEQHSDRDRDPAPAPTPAPDRFWLAVGLIYSLYFTSFILTLAAIIYLLSEGAN